MNNDNDIDITVKDELFLIIKKALRGTPVPAETKFNYDKIFSLAAYQNLFPLCFSALMNFGDFRNSEYYNKYLPSFLASFASQAKSTKIFLGLYEKFAENNIYPLVVKGIICRQLYGEFADCRPSGDEDIFVKKEDYFKTAEILEKEGFIPERNDVTENSRKELAPESYSIGKRRIDLMKKYEIISK